MKPIYLDYNATTPIDPEVAEAMTPYLNQHFGNPSSSHWYGQQTRQAVDQAREHVAALLHCQPDEIVFTGGGSEANNQAIKGVAEAYRSKGNHIIISQIEHPAVLNPCRYLEERGYEVTYLSVDSQGSVSLEDVQNAITDDTILITIIHANNEVGTIQPVQEIGALARSAGILFHTDAAQSVGKIPVQVDDLNVDLLSVAGHKLYAPKGIGALFIRSGIEIPPLIHGAGHEQGRRAGTENVLEIVGLGKACEIALRDAERTEKHLRELRDHLHEKLQECFQKVRLNGHPTQRLPNTLNVSLVGVPVHPLLDACPEVAVSTGSACHEDSMEPSPVLTAMGIPADVAGSAIRFSVGRMTTLQEIDRAVEVLAHRAEQQLP
ncbi:cysteine desulfurase family protein [Candidatus Poribacteria bacterium]